MPLAAHAGTYVVTFSGGTVTAVPAGGASPFTTNLVYQSVTLPGYSGVAGTTVTPDAQGHATTGTATVSTTTAAGQPNPLIAKFTWQPAQGQTVITDPPPTAAIVLQDCSAPCHSNMNYGPVTSACVDGLGGSVSKPADASTHSVQYVLGAVAADTSVSVSCSPSAIYTLSSGTAVGSNGSGNTLVTYNPTITPVTISLPNTILDANGKPHILIGQKCSASLSGIPTGCTASKRLCRNHRPAVETAATKAQSLPSQTQIALAS